MKFETRRIPVSRLMTSHEIVIGHLRYPVLSVEETTHGRLVTVKTGDDSRPYSQVVQAHQKVRVFQPPRNASVWRPGDNARERGNGVSVVWRREINGWPYSFQYVVMPNGERRCEIRRYNGNDDGTAADRAISMRFGCSWTRVHCITWKPESVAPRGWDKVEA